MGAATSGVAAGALGVLVDAGAATNAAPSAAGSAVAGQEESQSREITAEAPTVEEAKALLDGQVPDGWRLLSYRVPDR